MTLQHGDVVVQDGQIGSRVAEESGRLSRMIDVVADGSDEGDGLIQRIENRFQPGLCQEERGRLHHVRGVRRIVVRVVPVIGFDQREPGPQCRLVTIQSGTDIEVRQDGQSQPHEWLPIGDLF